MAAGTHAAAVIVHTIALLQRSGEMSLGILMMKTRLSLATLTAGMVAVAQPVRAQAPTAIPLAPVDYTFIGLTYLGN